MHRRPGALIRWARHSRPSLLILPKLLTAYRPFRPNQPIHGRLNMSEGQTLSATILKQSPSGATEARGEDRRCTESVFPLNFLNLDDQSCLVKNRGPNGEWQRTTKFCGRDLASGRVSADARGHKPRPKEEWKTGRIFYDLSTTCYSNIGISGRVL
jgi:hypothetical protein